MIRVLEGTPLKLTELEVRGTFYLPDSGSLVSVSVVDILGVSTKSTIVYETGDVVIPSAKIPLPPESTFTFYTVIVVFESGGLTLTASYPIRVQKSLPIFATADTVRGLLGVSETELPDEQIDLFSAYTSLEAEITDADFFSTPLLVEKTNNLLAHHCALDALTGLDLKALQQRGIDDHKTIRFSKVNFEKLQLRLESRYWGLRSEFGGDQSIEDPTLVAFAPRTDPFSGA